jgi:ankyrin repeat/SOCS box protein 13/metal transporter CNNM
VSDATVECDGKEYHLEELLHATDGLFWAYIITYMGLVLFAGLMSGLTMGLLSLDIMSLEVLKRGGKPHEQRYSRRILHLVKKHHLLLVTLLLANAVAVESMPIFLSKITTEVVAVVVSVTAVLVFGEPRATEHVVRRRGRFCELYASERRHSGM